MRILKQKGVIARMYLDDIITLSPDYQSALSDFKKVQDLLCELGLPEAMDKIQHPATNIVWLGIHIDSCAMSLSLPIEKLHEVKATVRRALRCKSLSKNHLQSILGRLLHVAKCVRPARPFVSRLLEALRSMKRAYIRVNSEMKKDLMWFDEFCAEWNGVGLIPSDVPSRCIFVDALGSGVGGTDGSTVYGSQVAPIHDPVANISEIEAANVVIALQTMLSEDDRGAHILIKSDSMCAVQVFTSGHGRNRVLLDCARSIWMIQSVLDINISYQHVPGNNNLIADALSRLHLDRRFAEIVTEGGAPSTVVYVEPNLDIFTTLSDPILSRSRLRISPGGGAMETNPG